MKILIIIGLLVSFSFGYAEEVELTFKNVDELTYQHYLAGEWDELIDLGKDALEVGFDFFNLRMRLAYAYEQKEKYSQAIKHRKQAMLMNEFSAYNKKQIYYDYLLLGMQDEALIFASGLNKNIRADMKVNDLIDTLSLSIEGGYLWNNNLDKNQSLFLMGRDSLFGEAIYFSDQQYLHGGLGSRISERVKVYAGYSRLDIDVAKRYQYNLIELQRDRIEETDYGYEYFYREIVKNTDTTFESKIDQNSIYGMLQWQINEKWSVIPSFHFIFQNYDQWNYRVYPSVQRDTAYYVEVTDTYGYFEYPKTDIGFNSERVNNTDWLVNLAGVYNYGFGKIIAEASYAELSSQAHLQLGLRTVYYPLGNLNFFGSTAIRSIRHMDDPQLLGVDANNLVLEQMLGVSITPRLWFEVSYAAGNMAYSHDNLGFVVYNIPNGIHQRASAKLNWSMSGSLEAFLLGDWFLREGNYSNFSVDARPTMYNFEYQSYSVTTGIKWSIR